MKNYRDKKWLENKYLDEKLSFTEIARICPVSRTQIWRLLKKFNIKTRKNYSEEIKQKQREHKIGEKNPNWKGGTVINSNGYALILKRNHPHSNNRSYVKRSKLVMEKYLGRYLEPEEVVHHENEIRHDDRKENLRLFESKGKHMVFHNKMRQNMLLEIKD